MALTVPASIPNPQVTVSKRQTNEGDGFAVEVSGLGQFWLSDENADAVGRAFLFGEGLGA